MIPDAGHQADPDLFQINAKRSLLTFSIPSEPRFVYQVLCEVEGLFEAQRAKGAWELTIVLRELLMNAVEHGNQWDSRRKVAGSVERLGKSRYHIVLEDEGVGFDYRGLEMTLPEDPKDLQDRGYTLINALTDQLEFNDSGNRITADLTLKTDRMCTSKTTRPHE